MKFFISNKRARRCGWVSDGRYCVVYGCPSIHTFCLVSYEAEHSCTYRMLPSASPFPSSQPSTIIRFKNSFLVLPQTLVRRPNPPCYCLYVDFCLQDKLQSPTTRATTRKMCTIVEITYVKCKAPNGPHKDTATSHCRGDRNNPNHQDSYTKVLDQKVCLVCYPDAGKPRSASKIS